MFDSSVELIAEYARHIARSDRDLNGCPMLISPRRRPQLAVAQSRQFSLDLQPEQQKNAFQPHHQTTKVGGATAAAARRHIGGLAAASRAKSLAGRQGSLDSKIEEIFQTPGPPLYEEEWEEVNRQVLVIDGDGEEKKEVSCCEKRCKYCGHLLESWRSGAKVDIESLELAILMSLVCGLQQILFCLTSKLIINIANDISLNFVFFFFDHRLKHTGGLFRSFSLTVTMTSGTLCDVAKLCKLGRSVIVVSNQETLYGWWEVAVGLSNVTTLEPKLLTNLFFTWCT